MSPHSPQHKPENAVFSSTSSPPVLRSPKSLSKKKNPEICFSKFEPDVVAARVG